MGVTPCVHCRLHSMHVEHVRASNGKDEHPDECEYLLYANIVGIHLALVCNE